MTQAFMNEKTQRLFVAIELPEAVRHLLTEQQKKLPGIRWTPPDNLHLTVRFIGEVTRAQAETIQTSLKSVQLQGFSLRLNGLGFFDKRPQAVVWAGILPSPSLTALKQQVDAALTRHADIMADAGRFSPHITLGRMKQADPKTLKAFTAGDNAALTTAFAVQSFSLFSSVLTPGGAVHTVEELYPLLFDKNPTGE